MSKEFVLTLVNCVLFSSTLHMTMPVIPLYWAFTGISEGIIGFLFSLSLVGVFFATPYVSRKITCRLCRPYLFLGMALFGLPFFLYPLTDKPYLFIIFRLLQGIGTAFYFPALYTIIGEISPPRRRGEAMGFFGIARSLVFAAMPAMGLAFIELGGYALSFRAAGSITLLGLALILPLRLRSNPDEEGNRWPVSIGEVIRMPGVYITAFILVVATISHGTISFIPLWADYMGIEKVGLFYTFTAASLFVGSMLGGKLSDRFGRLQIALPCLVILSISFSALNLLPGLIALLTAAVFFGIGFGALQVSTDAHIVGVTDPIYRGTAIAIYQAVYGSGLAMGQLFLGIAATGISYSHVYYLPAGFAIISFMFIRAYLRTQPHGSW